MAPSKYFTREKGAGLMLIAAVFYSFTSVMGRKVVLITGNAGNAGKAAFYPLINSGVLLLASLLS